MLEKEKGLILLVYFFEGITQSLQRRHQPAQHSDHSLALVTQRTKGQINRHLTRCGAHKRALPRYENINTTWGTVQSVAPPAALRS